MSVNKCIFIGRLTNDPDVRTMANGDSVTNISLALNEKYKTKDGEVKENVEYVRIVFFRRQAEVAGQYLRKGSKVYVEGKLKTRKWQDQNGQDRYTTEIQGDVLQMLDSRDSSLNNVSPQNPQGKSTKQNHRQDDILSEDEKQDFDSDIPF